MAAAGMRTKTIRVCSLIILSLGGRGASQTLYRGQALEAATTPTRGESDPGPGARPLILAGRLAPDRDETILPATTLHFHG
jgi:hypothetical protein